MNPVNVYERNCTPTLSRVDVIVALYRKALDRLQRAGALLVDQRADATGTLLAETQLIVSSLSAGWAGNSDPSAVNFLRLYEFVAHQLTLGALENIHAARRILAMLLEGFEAIRDQAVGLENRGEIPSLTADPLVCLTA